MSEKKVRRVRRAKKHAAREMVSADTVPKNISGFTKARMHQSHVPVPLASSQSKLVQSVLLLAASLEASAVASLLASLGHKNLANYLEKFDWQAALRLLPHLVEFADTFADLSGPEKEQKVLALCVRIAQMANVADMIDEDALESIRIIIATLCDIGSGKFKINAEQRARCFSFLTRALSWLAKHQPCCRASRIQDDNTL